MLTSAAIGAPDIVTMPRPKPLRLADSVFAMWFNMAITPKVRHRGRRVRVIGSHAARRDEPVDAAPAARNWVAEARKRAGNPLDRMMSPAPLFPTLWARPAQS